MVSALSLKCYSYKDGQTEVQYSNPCSRDFIQSSVAVEMISIEKHLSFSDVEFEMICSVVMHEVGHCSRKSKIAVTNVILNRLKDGQFGESISEILHREDQFTAIHNYYDKTIPINQECREAVLSALAGENDSQGALYYCNMDYVNDPYTKQWFESLEPLFQLDGQWFYQ